MNYNSQIDSLLQTSTFLDTKLTECIDVFTEEPFEYEDCRKFVYGWINSFLLSINSSVSIRVDVRCYPSKTHNWINFYLLDANTKLVFMELQNINTLREFITISRQFRHTILTHLLENNRGVIVTK